MKQLFFTMVIAAIFLLACSNEKKTDEQATAGAAEKKETAAVSYPYKAEYSSDFSIGDPNHSKMVLDLYKMWEEGKIDEMKPLLADSVFIDVFDGNKFNNAADSFITFAKQMRAGYKSSMPAFDGWIPVHSNDKNEDYVLVWSRDYWTTTDGKSDSLRAHAYFLIKNNKVAGWSEFSQKLTPPSPPAKK